MFLRFLEISVLVAATGLCQGRVLRVCGDPNNMPFSNEAKQGFENRIAQLLADDMGAQLEYVWWSQHKPFVKSTLTEGRCDVLLGMPREMDSVLATDAYYRSTYVFVTRKDRNLKVSSLYDPRFSHWRVGLHLVGQNFAPPAHALARRGIAANLVGFPLTASFGDSNPGSRIVSAVTRGEIDVAIVWGPFAGFFAQNSDVPLVITPVSPASDLAIPFVYSISACVRKDNSKLQAELNLALDRQRAAIQKVLSDYQVPQALEDRP
jgi:mxaJ protein